MNKTSVIFGNEMSNKTIKKANKSKAKNIKKFGDDSNTTYHLKIVDNETIGESLGVKNIILADESTDISTIKNPIIIGNIRMGFGHYRISMAMASCAKALGYTPLWFDLNSFEGTTCTKLIGHSNELYSMGSRWSQKYSLFNKLYWENLNYEGFRQISYNAIDQKNAELMVPVYKELPKDVPFIATHVWPSQGAIHAGLTNVVNAIPDNWDMALHLSEGATHAVQTRSSYLTYRSLKGMDKDNVLKPMPKEAIVYTGHYIDHELVSNIDADSAMRIGRANNGKAMRLLMTIGGAGAQKEIFSEIIKDIMPKVKADKATLFINFGDYKNVYDDLTNEVEGFKDLCIEHFDDFKEVTSFCEDHYEKDVSGIHVFYHKDIFEAVYSTNLLMRMTDLLVTKPSELAFYPIPKLFIKRVGGHERWGAIHASEVGDGTVECENTNYAISMINLILEDKSILNAMSENIIINNKNKLYNGAYEVVKLATKNQTKKQKKKS